MPAERFVRRYIVAFLGIPGQGAKRLAGGLPRAVRVFFRFFHHDFRGGEPLPVLRPFREARQLRHRGPVPRDDDLFPRRKHQVFAEVVMQFRRAHEHRESTRSISQFS